MRYFYKGSIKELRKHGWSVHFAKDSNKRFVYANKNYKSDYFNSLFIFLGEALINGELKNEIVFNNVAKKGDDIKPYIQDLIDDNLVAVEHDGQIDELAKD